MVAAHALRTALKHLPSDSQVRYLAESVSNKVHFETDFGNSESLLAPLLIPRPPMSENNTKIQNTLISFFSELGWKVETDAFEMPVPSIVASVKGILQFTNIIATHPPIDAPRKLVFAAHFDTLMNPPGFIGAIDSAGPIAIMMDLAVTLRKVLKASLDDQSPITLQFIFFDGEEALEYWRKGDSVRCADVKKDCNHTNHNIYL